MNCSQVRALLANYRELNTEERTTLDEHLRECAACQAIQAQYEHIGTCVRALPAIQPPAEMRATLMQALAAEHMRFMQHAPASTVTPPAPAFLAPYLRELAHKAPQTDHLAAFSTATTGPLPTLQQLQPRRVQRLNHFAIVGIAAAILLTLMGGSLASLLLLSPRGVSPSSAKVSVVTTSEVQSQSQDVTMAYPNLASAVEVNNSIYYTTYSDDQANWQIERFDEQTKASTPLLNKPSAQELDILGSSQNWLIWLQIDAPKAEMVANSTQPGSANTAREWSLHALYLSSATAANSIDPAAKNSTITNTNTAITLIANKKFNLKGTPSWVHKPVQGIAFYQNMLLAAIVDENGSSHLQQYALDNALNKTGKTTTPTESELASASNGHILASPTANSDGSSIYWTEEWFDGKNLLSNIWTQQTTDATPTSGRWVAHKEARIYPFRQDGKAFHPQIVADTLFILSTNPNEDTTPSTTAIPSPSPVATATPAQAQTSTPTPSATPQEVNPSSIPGSALKADVNIFKPQIDEVQTGLIFTFTTDGVPTQLPSFGYGKQAFALQGGAHFLLWLESDQHVHMYDVDAQVPVSVGAAVPTSTTFLTVNGDTAVVALNAGSTQPSNTITLNSFKWPWSIKKTTTKS